MVAAAYGQTDPGQEAAQQAVQNAQLAAQQAAQDGQLVAAQLALQASQQAMEQAQQANQQMMQAALNNQPPPSYPWPRRRGRSDKPTFLPRSGRYTSPTLVTMKADVPKASIYYTTDGSLPASNSNLYTGPVLLNSTTQIRAISKEPRYSTSKVVSGEYVITNTTPSQPAQGGKQKP